MGKARFILTAGMCSLFALLISTVARAQTQSSFEYDASLITPSTANLTKKNWAFTSGFQARGEGKDDGFASVFGADSVFDLEFSSWLKVETAPYVRFFSSRVQERFDDDTYESRIGLYYGHLTLTPLKDLQIQAGTIAQFHLNNSQMISSFRSFPGALVEYRALTQHGFSGGARAQVVVPTSASLNTQRQDREELPVFETQSLFLNYANPSVYFRSQIGRYAFSEMPARTAFDSTRAGNTPGNESLDPEVRLRYGFEGWFGDIEGSYIFDTGLSLGTKFKRFHNALAPSNLADSQMISLFGQQRMKSFSVALEGGTFFSEADSTVARYSSSGFGNTNRDGQFVEGRLDFEPFKFSLIAKYVNAREINNGPSQDNMTNLSLMLESYAFQF